MLEPKKIKSVTSRTSNQSILKEINPDAEGLMLKFKFQHFGHLVRRVDSLEKTLMLGKIEGRRRRGRQRMRWLDGVTDSVGMAWFVSAQLFEYCLLRSLFGRHLPGTSPN